MTFKLRLLGRIFLWRLAAAVLSLLAVELAGYAVWFAVADTSLPTGPQGLFVVFGGGADRVQRALALARKLQPEAFVVSDSSRQQLAAAFQAWGRPGTAKILYEPEARSTDQNAVYVGEMIRLGGFRSVVLATSWYHLPRAYALLRLELAGSGVRLYPVATEAVPKGGWKEWRFQGELKKFWPSIGRWAWFSAWGRFDR